VAAVIPLMRETHESSQLPVVVAGLVAGAVALLTGFAMKRALRVREVVIITGFVVLGLFMRLWSVAPLGRPRFESAPVFDVPWASDLRARLVEAASSLPSMGNQLVPGLAVGDTSLVSPDLDADMKVVSLTHLVAVSGANCAVITAGVIAVVALCGGGRWMRALAASTALALFVIVVGPQPSVIRATVMAIILLVAVSSGHPSRGVPVLGIAVFVLLLVDPTWALNIGFTLSVFATAALLLLAVPIAQRLERWMPRWLATVIAIPLAAELACQPVIALLAPGLPTYGIVANVLAAPAAPIATVTGLVAALVLPISQPVGMLLAWLCWIPAQWIANVASICAHLPFARLMWPGGLSGVLISVVLSGALVVLLIWARGRRIAAVIVVLTLGVSLTTTVVSQSWRRIGMPQDWLIAACDVAQGDAFIVRSSAESRSVMLIDTGRDENLLRRCLDDLGIDRIELLVLTHYDQDHVGAYKVVLGRVTRALVGKPVDESEEAIVRDLETSGAVVSVGHAGVHGNLDDEAFRWRALWPTSKHPDMQTGNPGSLVIRAEWPRVDANEPPLSAMFLGDLDEDAQRALLSSTAIRPATVVKVAHHGSADQYDRLYLQLRARLALVSVGADNGYGHPTDRSLGILAQSGTAVARTDLHGLVLVRRVADTTGHRLEVWTER
jgi:competence protein ComEC